MAAGTAYEVQVLATAEGIPDGPASTAVSGSPPDDSPLTASLEGPAGHNAQLSFAVRVTFSEPIRTSYVTMRDSAFDVTGGSVDAAYRVNYSSALWELRVIPSGRSDVKVALRANRACGNGGVCTKDGRRLSARAELSIGRISSTPPVQVSFNALSTVTRYVRERKGYWVGVGLNRKPGESVTIPLLVEHLGGASASDYTGVPTNLTFGAYQKSKGFTVEAVSDSLAESGEQIKIAFGSPLPSGISSQSGQETATLEITDADSRGASVMQSGPVLTSATASGSQVTLRFDRALDAGSTPAPGDFVVLAGHPHNAASVAVSRVEVAGRETHLALSRALRIDETVTASYLGGGMHPLQYSARLAAALADVPVRHAAARSGEPVEIAAKSAGAISPIAVPRRLDGNPTLGAAGLGDMPSLRWLWRDNALIHTDQLTSDSVRVFSGNGERPARGLDR